MVLDFFASLFGFGDSGGEKKADAPAENAENGYKPQYLDEAESDPTVKDGQAKDAYGDVISGAAPNTWNPYELTGEGQANVLGLPLYYNPLADPSGRVYNETFMQDLPIVYLVPGEGKINKKLIGPSGEKGVSTAWIQEKIKSGQGLDFGVRNVMSYNDTRFMSFRQNWKDYYNYVEVMLSVVYNHLGLSGVFKFSDEFKAGKGNPGIAFFADKATSISEGANNQFGESTIASSIASSSAQLREYKQLAGFGNEGVFSSLQNFAQEIMTGLSGIPIVGGLISAFGQTVNGSQLYYPDMWYDSKFEKSYNLQFKFYSPYGDRESIFKYVYVPFMSLLALALPRQDGPLGYKQPFLIRMFCPGYFETECGVVTSITFKRGGDDNLFTVDNLPTEIEVTVTVADLYSTVMASDSYGYLRYNAALSSFLECMAGIRFDQFAPILRAENFLKTRLSWLENKATLQGVRHGFYDWVYEKTEKLNNVLR